MSDDLTIPRPGYARPRRSRGGIDAGTRRLLMIASVLGGGLFVVLGATTLLQRHSGGIPIVAAESGPVRVKPENPGGLQVANANNEIFSGGSDTDVSKLAPPPEVPDPMALRPPAPPPAPARQAEPEAAQVPDAVPPPAAAMAAPMAAPAEKPAAKPVAQPAPAQPAAHQVVQAAPAKPPAKPEPKPTADKHPAPAVAGKGAVVQLAALSSEESARNEWQYLSKRMPELLNGRQPSFSRTQHDGHTFWRLRTTGFADAAQARAFCDKVKAKGAGCSVADF